MKKKNLKFSKKLLLLKESIAPLDARQIKGGLSFLCSIRESCPIDICAHSMRGTCLGSECVCSGTMQPG
ncbi:class I lanthipeptide [Taibaiella koreensis]|uniref:class I lanthipeptide n=1 Tax=Taibaiella koreensis TaxID=1268548 RepID=UPI001969010C